MSNNSRQENIWQLAGVVVLGVIALVLVYNEFFTAGSGLGFNFY
ncbi:MAG: hypothetical protein ACOY4Q_05385 [Bacillota bacterium]